MKLKPIIIFISVFMACPCFGTDMREASIKAEKEYKKAVTEAKTSRHKIFNNRRSLENAIAEIETEIEKLDSDIDAFTDTIKVLSKKEADLSRTCSHDETDMQEFSGAVRVAARGLETILTHSFHTVKNPERIDYLQLVLSKERFPGIDEVNGLAKQFMDEIALSGEVRLEKGVFTNQKGFEITGDVLTIGKFTAAYIANGQAGFLNYSEDRGKFTALSALPSFLVRRSLLKYMQGKTDSVIMDISGGTVLKQITHKKSIIERIKDGGWLVLPILAIGVFAFIIAIERIVYLRSVHDNTDRVMGRVNELANDGKWKECDVLAKSKKKLPVYNVLSAGLASRKEDRETLESILQEAILKELPRLERFLPMLNIMGAVSPLLGLLGTVTGMIATFHVITIYGTGDPRMMSGGISEALVTTMLGLCVAIPIMLVHTFLGRRVEHIIGDMEEKAVALTNIIFREQFSKTGVRNS